MENQNPSLLAYSLALSLGLILGSFYTALSSRIFYFFYGKGRKTIDPTDSHHSNIVHKWQIILLRPSFCFHCKKKISLSALLPILGYITSNGRCRNCHHPIGIWTLLGESYMGIVAVILLIYGYNWPSLIFSLLFCGHLYISLLTDSRLFILDPENALFLFAWALASLLTRSDSLSLVEIQTNLIAFAGTFLCFLLLFLLGRLRALGFGDVILASVIALFMGLPWSLLVLQFAALGSIIYIILLKKNLRAPAPIGAAMAFSVLGLVPISNLYEWILPNITYFLIKLI